MGRDAYAKQSLGVMHSRIKEARVVMIGAGGIGCELLKNLVLMGFGSITIVDLDTIDLSNLNRQFLFRHEHIKKPKALIAKESAAKFNPNVKIEAHHANIKDPQFNLDWFKSFHVVFNALDNMEARRHVNQMCIAADIPLVESGTTGYIGQASVIKKGITECYECYEKEQPKSFPVCTIRSTPSQPIHCIVWAKSYLFTEIFGTGGEEAPDLDFAVSEENADELKQLREETFALKRIRDAMGTEQFPKEVFNKVFKNDIETLVSMEDMWISRRRPEPYDFEGFSSQQDLDGSLVSKRDQTVWSPAESFAVFVDSLHRLTKRMEELKHNLDSQSSSPVLGFDKDDEDTLDFVAAAANLRSYIFGIETRSKFDIKQMAGNIIPAIATTNAIIAGACVLQAFKVLRGEFQKAAMFVTVQSTDRLMASDRGAMRPPNPDCPVCSVARAQLIVDPKRATLGGLVDILKTELGYGEDISVYSAKGLVYEDDEELEDNLSKLLADLGIRGETMVTIEESPKVNLVLNIQEEPLPEEAVALKLSGNVEIPDKPTKATPPIAKVATNGDSGSNGLKRKDREDDNLTDQASKRGKSTHEQSDDVVIIDDDPNTGAIEIDD